MGSIDNQSFVVNTLCFYLIDYNERSLTMLEKSKVRLNFEFHIEECKTKPPGKMSLCVVILGAEEEGNKESNDT